MEIKIFKEQIALTSTTQIEFMDITERIQEVIEKSGIREGQVMVYSGHTTMSVSVNHNEPMLLQDFMRILYKLVPMDDRYSHDLFELRKGAKSDGRSNGHSHCKALLLGASETIPLEKGRLCLTDKQSVFAIEFDGARKRDVTIQIMGV